MRDVPINELEAICPAIHAAAVRIGCTEVGITGRVWPGGRTEGPAGQDIRVVEFSWFTAAVVKGEAFFEESDREGFAKLLLDYGLSDGEVSAVPEAALQREAAVETPVQDAKVETVSLSIEVLATTRRELERQAAAAGLPIGAWLDLKFGASTTPGVTRAED